MQFLRPDISTICVGAGRQHGRGAARRRNQGQALLPAPLASGDPPAARRIEGQATDIEIHAREILDARDRLSRILSTHTGQSIEKIRHDTDRDNFMTGEQAVAYGMIDGVLTRRAESRSAVQQ